MHSSYFRDYSTRKMDKSPYQKAHKNLDEDPEENIGNTSSEDVQDIPEKRISVDEHKILGKSIGLLTVISMEISIKEPWKGEYSDESSGTCWFLRLPHQTAGDPTRYVATCYHVVENAFPKNGITVKTSFTGSKKIPAKVVAIMPEIDAAILMLIPEKPGDIDLRKFIPWQLGDDKILEMGETVNVYGYPMGQDRLKAVESKINGKQDGALQLDGAINPGHSGGPVVYEGKVVAWITSGLPFANSISYANPISILKAVLGLVKVDMKEAQIIRKGTLGIRYFSSNDDRLMAVGARGEQCTVETPCDCESGVVIKWASKFSDLSKPPFSVEPGDILCSLRANIEIDDKDEVVEFKIDNEGETALPWTDERMDLSVLLEYLTKGKEITVNIWKSNQKSLITGNVTLKDTYKNGLYYLYYPYQKLDYEVFAGLVVAEMTGDVVFEFPRLEVCMSPDGKEDPHVVIVNIFLGSVAAQSGNLKEGSVVKKINGIAVTNMREYRDALRQPLQEKYLFIETDKNRSEVLNLHKVLQTEEFISQQYGFPLSDTYKFYVPK